MTPRRIVVVASVWLLLSLSLLGSDADPAIPVLAGLVAVLASAVFVIVDVGLATGSVDWVRGTRVRERAVQTDARVAELRRDARASVTTDSRVVEATLITLVDDALFDRHQIDRSRDPGAADRVLSERLRTLVAGSSRRSLSPRDLQRLLTDIEAL